MNDAPDLRQDKSYRRGLVLGLTMAEVMILLIFLLLMALAAALANREDRLQLFERTPVPAVRHGGQEQRHR